MCSWCVTSASITLLSVDSDLLIEMPSCARLPVAFVLFRRSLPARSTKLSFPRYVTSSVHFLHTVMVKMAWLRLDSLFISVEPVERLSQPSASSRYTSFALCT